MNCTNNLPSTVAEVCILSRFISKEFFKSSKHFSTAVIVKDANGLRAKGHVKVNASVVDISGQEQNDQGSIQSLSH
ncbi:MAG: hypothetical protein HQK77_22190 [Desulfobacterales bacterium]|nr:hypothetical protein [Desulfobacterales bacterium]